MKKYILTILTIIIPVSLCYGQLLYDIEIKGTLTSVVDNVEHYNGKTSDAHRFSGDIFVYLISVDASIENVGIDPEQGMYPAITSSLFATNAFGISSELDNQSNSHGAIFVKDQSNLEMVSFTPNLKDFTRIDPAGDERILNSPSLSFLTNDIGMLSSTSLANALNVLDTFPYPEINFSWQRTGDFDTRVDFSSVGTITSINVTAVPEPSTFAMIGVSVIGLLFFRKRLKKQPIA